jgi:hypothetical protein
MKEDRSGVDVLVDFDRREHEIKLPLLGEQNARAVEYTAIARAPAEGFVLLACRLPGRFSRRLPGLGHRSFGLPEIRIGLDPAFRGIAHARVEDEPIGLGRIERERDWWIEMRGNFCAQSGSFPGSGWQNQARQICC